MSGKLSVDLIEYDCLKKANFRMQVTFCESIRNKRNVEAYFAVDSCLM